MPIRRKLLLAGGSLFCIAAIAIVLSAATENLSDNALKKRELNTDYYNVVQSPTIEVSPGEQSASVEKATVCNGDWMGTPKYSINNWFVGREYYATYQDPLETGCPGPIAYPFEVHNVKWHVFNQTANIININLQPVIYNADLSNPLCPKPGEVCCYGPLYNVNIPVGSVLITMPETCCVYGPYFVGVYAPDSLGTMKLGVVTDSAGFGGTYGAKRNCANYNNYLGLHEDLIVTYGFPGNLRLWSDGDASDVNSCDPCVYTIEPGVDLWTSPPGISFENHFTAMPVPADFFGPGSDPFNGSICLTGSPLTTNPTGALGSTDAIIRRLGPVSLPSIPDVGAVPIEIVALNLVSCNPITVTYISDPPELWNVNVTLSSNVPQQQGQMTIRKSCCNGGTFDSQLPVSAKFIFTRVSDNAQRVLDLGGIFPPISFQSTGSHWSYDVPPPFDLVTSPGLVFCDHDLSPITPDVMIEPSSKFAPGIRTLPCDPQSPNAPYCGGKSLTLEQEQLAQHGVLPPQETTPQEGACCLPDGSCIVTDPVCCQTLGGTYLGDFTSCPLDCTPDTIYDTLCSEASIIVTLNPGDPSCLSPNPPINMTAISGTRVVVRRTPGPPYLPGQIIETELLQMSLIGTDPFAGQVILRESPSRPSMGRVQVINTNASGNLTLGDSFFDVFFEIDMPMIGRSAFNPNPTRMQAQLTSLKPGAGTVFARVPGPPDLLLDNPGGFPVGYLCDARHTIISCDCCVSPRGDLNGDGTNANIIDLNYAVNRIFRGGALPPCTKEGDVNSDGTSTNIIDLNFLVNRIFRGGAMPGPC